MISIAELGKLQGVSLTDCNLSELVDLGAIAVDKEKPLDKRIENFVSKVNNPYLFKVDDVAVKVKFTGTKPFAQVLSRCFVIGE